MGLLPLAGCGGGGGGSQPLALAITSTPPATATVGSIYVYTITVNRDSVASVSATALPGWLSVVGAQLIGTPAVGDIGVTPVILLAVTNTTGLRATQGFQIAVQPTPVAPQITSTPQNTATVGQPYSYTVVTTGTPAPTISATAPSWLAVAGNTLQGTPLAADIGANSVTITASNGALPDATQSFTITVSPPATPTAAPAITSTPPGSATVGFPYTYAITTTGSPTPNLTATGLPAWLVLAAGTISGTPGANDFGTTGPIQVTAQNGVNPDATQTFTVTVTAATTGIFGGAIEWDFAGAAGNEPFFNASVVAPDIRQPVPIRRGPGVSPTVAVSSISSDGWTTASAPDPADYYTFTVTPSAGFQIEIGDMTLETRRSGTGIQRYALRSSLDGFAADLATFAFASGNTFPRFDTVTITALPQAALFKGLTSPTEFRLFGYQASGGTGTWRISTLAVNATVTAVTVTAGAPTITSTAPGAATVGALYSYPITVSGTPTPTIGAQGLPGWLSLAGNVLSGTPAPADVGPNGPITITAANGNAPNASQTFTITVTASPAPFITTTPPLGATEGVLYTYTVTATGTPAPTLAAPTRPSWLGFDAATGVLSGTPTSAEAGLAFAVTITASNGAGPDAVQPFTIQVAAAPTGDIVTFDLSREPGTQASTTATAVAAGLKTPIRIGRGPGVTPSTGLNSINSSGWVTTATSLAIDPDDYYGFTVTPSAGFAMSLSSIRMNEKRSGTGIRKWAVRSSLDGFAGDIAVFSVPDDENTRTNQTAALGVAFRNLLQPIEFRIFGYQAEGALGTWRIDRTLAVSGTITAAPGSNPNAPTFTSAPIVTATAGQLYDYTPAASGSATITFTAVNKPAWASFEPATGRLFGTPGSGDIGPNGPITIVAANGVTPDATQTFTIDVSGAPQFTSTPPATATVNQIYSYTPAASGAPAPAIAPVLPLPGWLAFSGGVLSGVPNSSSIGAHTVTFTATNGIAPDASQTFTITVSPAPSPPAIPSSPQPFAIVGVTYTYDIVANGTPTPTTSVAGQPGWLLFDAAASRLSGTPQASDVGPTGVIRVTATNGAPPDAVQEFTITVDPAPSAPVIQPIPNQTATENVAFALPLNVTGNPTPAVGITGLPIWLRRNGLTLSGTPGAQDGGLAHAVTVTATNASGTTSTAFVLTVASATAVTLVRYDMAGNAGTEASEPPAFVAANVSASNVTRGTGISANAGLNSLNSTGFNQATDALANSTGDFYTLTLTPQAGFQVSLAQLAILNNRSATGPASIAIRSDLDGFTANIVTFSASTSTTLNTVSLGSSIQAVTVSVQLRLVGFSGTGGTWRLNAVTVTGAVRPISPLPRPVLAEGFEGGALPAGWAAGVGAVGTATDWSFGAPARGPRQAFVGSGAASTGLAARYTSNTVSTLDTPVLDLTGVSSPTLRFHHFYEAERDSPGQGFDGAYLRISTDGGLNFSSIDPASVSPAYDGTINLVSEPAWFGLPTGTALGRTYDLVAVSLTASLPGARDLVVLRWEFSADRIFEFDGWTIDEVYVGDPAGFPAPPSPEITSRPAVTVGSGQPFSYTAAGTGAPVPTVSFAGLPPWLTQAGATISGSTTTAGIYGPVTVTLTNGVLPDAVQTFTITVAPAGGPTPLVEYFDGGALPEGWTAGTGPGTAPSDWEFGTPGAPGAFPNSVNGDVGCAKTVLAGNYRPGAPGRLSFLQTPSLDLSSAPAPTLRFEHFHDIEPDADGAILLVSTDGGVHYRPVGLNPLSGAAGIFVLGAPQGRTSLGTSPLLGEAVWDGSTAGGAYDSVEVDLGLELAGYPAQNVVFRFALGSDHAINARGWFVDSVRIGDSPALPPP